MTFVQYLILSLGVHWLADFTLQTNEQAKNKWNSVTALTGHVCTYTFSFMLVWGCLFPRGCQGLAMAVILGVTHWCIDFCTSKLTHRLYAEDRHHDFFNVIGFDQLLHSITIIWLLWIALGNHLI